MVPCVVCGPGAPSGPCQLAWLLLPQLSSVLTTTCHPVNYSKCPQGPAGDGCVKVTHNSVGTGILLIHLRVMDLLAIFCTSGRMQPRANAHLLPNVITCSKECSESKGTGQIPDRLAIPDVKCGVQVKNYEETAKTEELRPVEVEL